jgi:hypothetical protein
LLFRIINRVLIACQANEYKPMIKTGKAKPVPVDQGSNDDGTWTAKALSVSYQGILSQVIPE